MANCRDDCYTSTAHPSTCKCSCGGANHGKGTHGTPTVGRDESVVAAQPPATPGREFATRTDIAQRLDAIGFHGAADDMRAGRIGITSATERLRKDADGRVNADQVRALADELERFGPYDSSLLNTDEVFATLQQDAADSQHLRATLEGRETQQLLNDVREASRRERTGENPPLLARSHLLAELERRAGPEAVETWQHDEQARITHLERAQNVVRAGDTEPPPLPPALHAQAIDVKVRAAWETKRQQPTSVQRTTMSQVRSALGDRHRGVTFLTHEDGSTITVHMARRKRNVEIAYDRGSDTYQVAVWDLYEPKIKPGALMAQAHDRAAVERALAERDREPSGAHLTRRFEGVHVGSLDAVLNCPRPRVPRDADSSTG